MKFTELNLNEQLLEAISHMGFVTATPIQQFAIPKILENKDLIACAQTGTGKTAAFILPILNKLTSHGFRYKIYRPELNSLELGDENTLYGMLVTY